MNNEPVAWMFEKDGAYMCIKHDNKVNYDGGIPLYTHPVKELHLSLQKSKETGELLAVTYTDDEHRIVEVLWQKPPAKTLTDEEITDIALTLLIATDSIEYEWGVCVVEFARAILRKAQE